jgi:hypothetical protein
VAAEELGEPAILAASSSVGAESLVTAARPKFAELEEEPAYIPLPRDYVQEFPSAMRAAASLDERHSQPVAAAVFPASSDEAQRDLDTPAFMRRLQF